MSEYDLIVRKEIDSIVKEFNINYQDFHEVHKNSWKNIQDTITDKFLHYDNTRNTNLHWAWQRLKGDKYGLQIIEDNAYEYIDKLISIDETIWFIAENDFYKAKHWIYEGKVQYIKEVLKNSSYYEYYLVSKKYEWILCENHHGILIGAGEKIVTGLERLKNLLNNKK